MYLSRILNNMSAVYHPARRRLRLSSALLLTFACLNVSAAGSSPAAADADDWDDDLEPSSPAPPPDKDKRPELKSKESTASSKGSVSAVPSTPRGVITARSNPSCGAGKRTEKSSRGNDLFVSMLGDGGPGAGGGRGGVDFGNGNVFDLEMLSALSELGGRFSAGTEDFSASLDMMRRLGEGGGSGGLNGVMSAMGAMMLGGSDSVIVGGGTRGRRSVDG